MKRMENKESIMESVESQSEASFLLLNMANQDKENFPDVLLITTLFCYIISKGEIHLLYHEGNNLKKI